MGKPVVVSIVGDNRDLDRALGQSEGRLSKFGKVSKVAMIGFAGATAGAVVVGAKLVKSAAEDQQAAALLAKQLRNSTGATNAQVAATERWISKQGLLKGVTDDELRPALSNLVTATHDVGKAQKLASLAMDIAAAKGLPLASVSKALAKAQNGQVSGLSRLGVATKDASGKTLTFTQLQKNLNKEFGGSAATKAATFGGVVDRVKIFFTEAGESLGAKLLPVLTRFGNFMLTTGVPAISRFASEMKDHLAPFIAQAGTAFQRLQPTLSAIGTMIVTQVIPAFQQIGEFIITKVVPAVLAIYANVATKLQPVIAALTETISTQLLPAFESARPTLEKVALIVLQVTGTVLGLAAAILGKVLPPAIRLVGFLLGTLIPAAAQVILAIARVVSTVVNFGTKLVEAGADAGRFAGKVVSAITGIPDKLGDVAGLLVDIGKDLIRGIITGIRDSASDLVDAIKSFVLDKIPGPVKKVLGISSPSRVMAEIGRNVVQGVVVGVRKESPALRSTMGTLGASIATFGATPLTPTARPQLNANLVAGRASTNVTIEVKVAPTANRAEIGREVAGAVRAYYEAGGARL